METYSKLKSLGEKVEKLKNRIETEESTKHAFILPFINILGYDTFNPLEVIPEYTCDIGTKKGEKVDYAIFQNEEPILIIECKHWDSELSINNSSQLFRYFHATKTKFALLTNGITYKFYTDLVESNKMDEKPFLEFNITKIKELVSKEVDKFHKSKFDVSKIFNNASDLKYTKEIKKAIENEINQPSTDFIKLFANKVYSGRLTSNVLDEFNVIVSKAFSQFISEKVNDRLNLAITKEQEKQDESDVNEEQVDDSGIITTDEELEAYKIVVAILRRKISIERIYYRDTKSYFGILLDDNNRKTICRVRLNTSNKYIGILDKEKNEIKHSINSIDEIYNYENELLNVIDFYDNE